MIPWGYVDQSTRGWVYDGPFRSDWRNSRLFVDLEVGPNGASGIAMLDARTLQPLVVYQRPSSQVSYAQISAFFVNATHLYVAYRNQPLLAEYDIEGGQLTRSWKFQSDILSLLGSDNGRYLFACTSSDQWIVDLGGNP